MPLCRLEIAGPSDNDASIMNALFKTLLAGIAASGITVAAPALPGGETSIGLLSDGPKTLPASILIGATPELVERYADKDGAFAMAYNAFLIVMEGRHILVDTGEGAPVVNNLKNRGLEPGQIDAILLTHLHPDHIGGMLRDGKAVFPNAQVYISRREFAYWTDPATASNYPAQFQDAIRLMQQMVDVYKDRIRLIVPGSLDQPGAPVIPGLRAVAAPGHTPGHTMYLLESDGGQLLIWGDIAHAMAIQMPRPDVSVHYDTDPALAAQTRSKVLRHAADRKLPVAGMHIPSPAMGTVVADGAGYRFIPVPQ